MRSAVYLNMLTPFEENWVGGWLLKLSICITFSTKQVTVILLFGLKFSKLGLQLNPLPWLKTQTTKYRLTDLLLRKRKSTKILVNPLHTKFSTKHTKKTCLWGLMPQPLKKSLFSLWYKYIYIYRNGNWTP